MRELIAKKARRKCLVRGCKNVSDVYAIARTNECGNSVIMCMECAKAAFAAMEKTKGGERLTMNDERLTIKDEGSAVKPIKLKKQR